MLYEDYKGSFTCTECGSQSEDAPTYLDDIPNETLESITFMGKRSEYWGIVEEHNTRTESVISMVLFGIVHRIVNKDCPICNYMKEKTPVDDVDINACRDVLYALRIGIKH